MKFILTREERKAKERRVTKLIMNVEVAIILALINIVYLLISGNIRNPFV